MSNLTPASAIRQFQLQNGAYVPIVAPIPCNYYEIIGTADGSAMTRSSDGTDANSYPFPATGWYGSMAPARAPMIRYQPGDVVTFLKGGASAPLVFVEFIL